MSETKTYNDPNLRLSKIYTKSGDEGMTSLVNGRRVAKNHARIEAWRQREAERLTQERRPDLWRAYVERHGEAAQG